MPVQRLFRLVFKLVCISFQDLILDLPFIRSLIADLKAREGNLVGLCNDFELKRIHQSIEQLSEDLENLQKDDLLNNFTVDELCLGQDEFVQSTVVNEPGIHLKKIDKATNGHPEYGENDSDLDNSESGVSSMESLESLLKKSEGESSSEQQNGSEQAREQQISPRDDEKLNEESTVSDQPTYEKENDESNGNKIEVPVLILTDENGVVYSDKPEGSGPAEDQPLTSNNDSSQENAPDGDNETIPDSSGENDNETADEVDGKNIKNDQEVVEGLRQSSTEEIEADSAIEKVPDKPNDLENNTASVSVNSTTRQIDEHDPLDSSGNHDDSTNEAQVSSELPISDDKISIESSSHQCIINSSPASIQERESHELSSSYLDNDADLELDKSNTKDSSYNLDEEDSTKLPEVPLKQEHINGDQSNVGYLDLNQKNHERTNSPANSQVSMEVQLSDGNRSPFPGDHSPGSNLVSLLNRENNTIATVSNKQSIFNVDQVDNPSGVFNELASLSETKFSDHSPTGRTVDSFTRGSSSYESPYFKETLEKLRELNDDEVPLTEGMSLSVFVVEVEKLLEKLRVIEDMMRACNGVYDDVKDELARHVVS